MNTNLTNKCWKCGKDIQIPDGAICMISLTKFSYKYECPCGGAGHVQRAVGEDMPEGLSDALRKQYFERLLQSKKRMTDEELDYLIALTAAEKTKQLGEPTDAAAASLGK